VTYYRSPDQELQFGDIFQAALFFDAHLREDAGGLFAHPIKGNVMAYLRDAGQTRDYLFAHGTECLAVLLTDPCTIDDVLGVDREKKEVRGRFLFAALMPGSEAEIRQLIETPTFNRFPFPPERPLSGGIASFQKLFMVDARDLSDPTQHRVCSLEPKISRDLEVQWVAYCARRGPLAATKSLNRLLEALVKPDGEPTQQQLELAANVARLVTAVWNLEGEDLDEANWTGGDASAILKKLQVGLGAVRDLAEASIVSLGALSP